MTRRVKGARVCSYGTYRCSGTAKDSEDALQFSALTGVRPMIERYPLEKAADAYDQMISGRARFRVVLTVAS
jgi:D-arabinose 1-dehydrogenase-like Zn-dependent alcohol dehydrogenase